MNILVFAPHPDDENIAFDEAVIRFSRYRGAMTGKGKYVECFAVLQVSSLTEIQ